MKRFNTKPANPETGFGPDWLRIEPQCLEVGNSYCASFAVTGFPREVRPGWLEPLVNYPATIDVAVHVEPTPAVIAADRLRRQMARLESSRRLDADKGKLADPYIEIAANDAHVLADRLARGEAKLFRVGLYVTIRATSAEELGTKTADVQAVVASLLAEIRPTTYRQLRGWTTTLPAGIDAINIKRSFDTAALAASYPFVTGDFSDAEGILYGRNAKGSGLVFWDRFNQDNHNATILARSGSGKSYLAKLEILRNLYRGTDVLVVDPEDEYSRLANSVNGTHISLGAPGVQLNPLDLDSETDAFNRRALFLHSFIAVLLGETLSSADKATLDQAIVTTYSAAGITADARTHKRLAPTLGDLVRSVAALNKSLADKLMPFVSGSYGNIFNGSTTTIPQGHLVVFSLRALPDEAKSAATMLALDHIWKTISDPKNIKRRMVVVDEAWLLMRDPAGAKFLFRLAKSARKYWCGLTVITQDGADLLGTELGQAVVANSATQILMRQSTQSIDAICQAFNLSEGERTFLLSADRGEAILAGGAQRVAFRTVASEFEHRLCTSSPAEMTEYE